MSVEMLSLIIAFCTLLGSMIAVYVAMNIKIAEINVKVLECENKLNDMKQEKKEEKINTEKINDKVWQKLESIESLLNQKFQDFAVLQNEHNKMLCKYEHDNKNYSNITRFGGSTI